VNETTNDKIMTPEKAARLFQKELSSASVFMHVTLFLYFSISLGISFPVIYYWTKQYPSILEFPNNFLLLLFALIGVALALIVCHLFVAHQFKGRGIKDAPIKWRDGAFKEWQVLSLKKNANLMSLKESKSKLTIVDAYLEFANDKIESISPFVKPAVIMGFVVPVYSVFLKRLFDFADNVEQLFSALMLVGVFIGICLSVYILGATTVRLNVDQSQLV